MAAKGGDKTEKPTPHALREARKRGDIAKSRDVGLALGLLFAATLLWWLFGSISARFVGLWQQVIVSTGSQFESVAMTLVAEAVRVFLTVSAIVIVPIVAFQLLLEYLQTGPVFTAEKIKPRMRHLDPVAGLKRLFSAESLFDLGKSLLQVCLLFWIGYLVIRSLPGDLTTLVWGEPGAMLEAVRYILVRIVGWTLLAYLLLMLVDVAFQRNAFMKRMMMSRRDIRREHKDNEGDPQVKQVRRHLAMEWSQEGVTQAARQASVLVVNPTHVAVAILYDAEKARVPIMTARGEEEVAQAMREAAEHAGVPILRHEQLARTLLGADTENDLVPRELFDIVAEVILWARAASERVASTRDPSLSDWQAGAGTTSRPAPGEDLTRYDPVSTPG